VVDEAVFVASDRYYDRVVRSELVKNESVALVLRGAVSTKAVALVPSDRGRI
jgi:hypothetical protein